MSSSVWGTGDAISDVVRVTEADTFTFDSADGPTYYLPTDAFPEATELTVDIDGLLQFETENFGYVKAERKITFNSTIPPGLKVHVRMQASSVITLPDQLLDASPLGATLINKATQVEMQQTLGLGTAATAAATSFALAGHNHNTSYATIGHDHAGIYEPAIVYPAVSPGTKVYLGDKTWGTLSAGSGTVTSVAVTQPAAGITVTGSPITASGTIALALADDLAAVEALATTGFARRTAANTWSASDLIATDITDSTATGRSVLTAASTLAARTAIAAANEEQPLILALSDETTVLTTGTKLTFRAPYAMTLTQIPRASVKTASSSGIVTVDIKEAGTTILGTNKLTIDATEKTSVTAATATTLADTSIADDAEITFELTAAGTGATGLKVVLYHKRA